MKKLVWLGVAAICSASCLADAEVTKAPVQSVAAGRFAVVNLEDVLSKDIQSIEKTRNEKMKKVQAQLQKEQTEIQKALADYQKNAPTMKKEAKDSLETSLSNKYNNLLSKRNTLIQQVEKEINDQINATLGRFKDAVERAAKEGGYAMVLRSDMVPYCDPALNITQQTKKEYNKGGRLSKAPLKALTAGK